MLRFSLRPRLAVLGLSLMGAPLVAQQQLPTPAQAQQLLQSNPDLIQQLQQRLQSSGMTPDQIRARLRGAGYPEGLLDAYLGGGNAAAGAIPNANVFAAVQALGIVNAAGLDSLLHPSSGAPGSMFGVQMPELQMQSIRAKALCDSVALVDSLQLDSLRASVDSMHADSLLLDSATRIRRGLPPRSTKDLTIRGICRQQDFTQIQRDSGFVIFGLDMFSRNTTQFEPNLAGPVDPNYRLGPGDQLVLILTGDVENAYSLVVTREGFMVIPNVGQLHVANLTMTQVDDLLRVRLGRAYSGVKSGTTHFSISVSSLRSNQVFVVGDVEQPGSYRISSAGTVLTALYAAGGPTENGSLRLVQVRRAGHVVDSLDVYDYLLRGDASHDVRLQSGDVVFVPVHGARARVVGEVVRPATYELAAGESLSELIRAAGGYTPIASHRRVQIERILPPGQRGAAGGRDRIVVDISSQEMSGAEDPPVALAAGDIVRVFPVSERVRNRITVAGDVWSPGSQGFTPGMHLSDAITGAGGVKPDVYAGEVLITRFLSDSSRVQLRATLRDSTGRVLNDPELHEDDQVRIFSVAEFRPRRYVAITGAVRKSGRVPYRDGMTLRDLVLLAGGLQEGAYLNEAEVARLPENRAGGVTATTIRVPLDSTYLFERDSNGGYLGPPGIAAPSGSAPEVPLKPYDNVLILRQPGWELQRSVVVAGEVAFPGRYTLISKGERLADVIQRAGGFTTSAYPDGIVFYRHKAGLGRIGVDLPTVMRNPGFRDDLILQDGDSLFIPAYSGVVNVTGEVNSPVAVAYVPGQDLDGYIRAAGGPAQNAATNRAYVRQPNGKVESVQRHRLWPDGVPEPKPGSVVVVPAKSPADKSNTLANLSVVAQVVGSLVAIVAIIASR